MANPDQATTESNAYKKASRDPTELLRAGGLISIRLELLVRVLPWPLSASTVTLLAVNVGAISQAVAEPLNQAAPVCIATSVGRPKTAKMPRGVHHGRASAGLDC